MSSFVYCLKIGLQSSGEAVENVLSVLALLTGMVLLVEDSLANQMYTYTSYGCVSLLAALHISAVFVTVCARTFLQCAVCVP